MCREVEPHERRTIKGAHALSNAPACYSPMSSQNHSIRVGNMNVFFIYMSRKLTLTPIVCVCGGLAFETVPSEGKPEALGRCRARGPAHVPSEPPSPREHAGVICVQLPRSHHHGALRTHGTPPFSQVCVVLATLNLKLKMIVPTYHTGFADCTCQEHQARCIRCTVTKAV